MSSSASRPPCRHHLSFLTGFVALARASSGLHSQPSQGLRHAHTHTHIRTHKHDLSSNQIETFVNATTAKLLILARERRSSDEANHVWLSAKEATVRLLTRLTSSHRQGEGAAFCGGGFYFFSLLIWQSWAQDRIISRISVGMAGRGVIVTVLVQLNSPQFMCEEM